MTSARDFYRMGELQKEADQKTSNLLMLLRAHGQMEEMLERAAQTLREIADCDETGHTGMTWAQEEARKALKEMREIGNVN